MNDKIINLVDYLLSLQSVIIADASAPYTQDDRIVALNMHMNVGINTKT